jgi:hypothetical protein
MSTATNTGKSLNELRTQNAELQTQIIDAGGAVTSIDLTAVDSAYVAWVHPIGTAGATITYYGKQVFANPDVVDAGYGLDLAIGDLVTIEINGPFPINLKECVVTATVGSAKVSFGRV